MGDIRLDERNEELFGQVVAKSTLVLRKLGARKDELAAHRFLDNDRVDPEMILAPHVERTRRACRGLRILVAQDTTEVNFKGRAARRKGLGPAGDGVSPGFFIHPQVAIDAETGAVLGVVGAEIWTRKEGKAGPRRERSLAEKESLRWLTGMETAAGRLGDVTASLIVVGDRESDIYPVLARRPEGVDVIVRAAHDRALEEGGLLKSAGALWDVLARARITVPGRRAGDTGSPTKARETEVEISAGKVTMKRPRNGKVEEGTPETLSLGLVIVEERAPLAGAEPICWRLLTTLPVATAADAKEVIRLYRRRWRIEEVFRTLKTDGLDLEASQVTEGKRLFKLAALGLAAAVRIIQLVDARDGSTRPATDVIEEERIEAVAAIGKSLEGRTPRQKNPWAKGTLASLAWICARLGGWNCYYRKPGPKTMADGWRRLAERLEGYALAESLRHV